MKLIPGIMSEKWVNFCIDLVKSRLSTKLVNKYSIKNINIIKTWKIVNKKQKIIFDSIYDHLIETNGKSIDDKKYHDFYFLHLDDIKDENDILDFLFEKFNDECVGKVK